MPLHASTWGRWGRGSAIPSAVNSQASDAARREQAAAPCAPAPPAGCAARPRAVRPDHAAAVEAGQRPGQTQRLLQPAHPARRPGADDRHRHARRLQPAHRSDGGRRQRLVGPHQRAVDVGDDQLDRSCSDQRQPVPPVALEQLVRRRRAVRAGPVGVHLGLALPPIRRGSAAPPPSRPPPCRPAGTASRRRSSRRTAASRSRCCSAP